MVRVNILNPKYLTDQHLIAEYLEILMLASYTIKAVKTRRNIPREYCLGKGHMLFFTDKGRYLEKRHEQIRTEMKKRGFVVRKKINLRKIGKENLKDWRPSNKEKKIIGKRLIEKINLKPGWYRYYREPRTKKFFIELIKNAK